MHGRRRTSGVFYGHMESHKVVILLIAIKKKLPHTYDYKSQSPILRQHYAFKLVCNAYYKNMNCSKYD